MTTLIVWVAERDLQSSGLDERELADRLAQIAHELARLDVASLTLVFERDPHVTEVNVRVQSIPQTLII